MLYSPEDLERGRATAGLPSLLPERRAGIAAQLRMENKRDSLISDAQTRDKDAGKPDGDRPRTVKDASGWWMNTDEFIRRLCRLTSVLHFEPTLNFSDRISVYRLTNDPENPKVYVGAFHRSKIPEFSVFDKKTHAVKMMGWRTVLLRLVTSKVITQSAVETVFGPPRASSKNWQRLFSW